MSKRMNLLIFSCEFDKALAALILANSARELNIDVTLFFAFWGLFLIRDSKKLSLKDKTLYEKMFDMVTPKGVDELPLSHMNFAGIGKKILQKMMKDDDAPTLEAFLKGAIKKDVKLFACKLSVDVMGLTQNELLPNVSIIDATTYLKDSLESDIQLFI